MIVWLNGAFGVGKTTTAAALTSSAPFLRRFDPELLGWALRHSPRGRRAADFQDLQSWRRLVPVFARGMIRMTGHDLVIPQSVLDPRYWSELRTGLADHQVIHVVLYADADTLRRRIDADRRCPSAREGRLQHLEDYVEAAHWLRAQADLVIDTSVLTPYDAARRILVQARSTTD